MDRIAEWRPVEPAGPDGAAESPEPDDEDKSHRAADGNKGETRAWQAFAPALALVTVAGLICAVVIGSLVLSNLPESAVAIVSGSASPRAGDSGPVASLSPSSPAVGDIVVDVEGAVQNPGVWRVPSGSRLGDAISAAGGYSAQVDIEAASVRLNLAEQVTDGQQVHVPLRGELTTTPAPVGTAASGGPGSTGATGGGLINVNTASEQELDTLPGIGPVTAAKITAARGESAFSSIDDLQQRGVVGQSVLDKIRELITVGP